MSRYVGSIFLTMSISALCYILSAMSVLMEPLFIAGSTIDILMFAMIVRVGYVLWANKQPSGTVLPALVVPFAVLAILNVFRPAIRDNMPDIGVAVLLSYFIFFEFRLQKHERLLEDLYSNPELHSIKWRWSLIVFLAGWFTIRHILLAAGLTDWYDSAMYLFMSVVILFVFIKVINFRTPVRTETLDQVGAGDDCSIDAFPDTATPLQAAFLQLLEQNRIFLNPDLTVEDVVKDLGTNSKYFSMMLHNDMHTTFYKIVNGYRVEQAKELLKSTDDKIEQIAKSSGFNSHQSFIRTFARITGKTPSEWRNQ